MKFKNTIKSAAHRIIEAKKKKELEVIVSYKKELIPFLSEIKKNFLIYKYIKKNNRVHIFLRKNKNDSSVSFDSHRQKTIRAFFLEGFNYRKPMAVCFVSTTKGILPGGIYDKGSILRVGGKQLFIYS
jgi:hypothetical protein